MKKKLLSLFMACAMILALAVPAFATPYFEHGEDAVSADLTQPVTITTRTFVPTVKLTLPTLTEPSIVLNPYKIAFTGEEDLLLNGYAVADTGEQVKQVISPVYTIKNQTNVKLNYTVAVTGTVEGGVTFSQEPVSLTEKNKKAHVALMVANKGAASAAIDNAASTPQNIVGFGADSTATPPVAGLAASDIETQYLKTSEVKFTQPKSLEPGNSTANYVAFQFKGDLTRLATPNAWTAEDKIGAVITFTFTPESAQDFTVPETSAVQIGASSLTVTGTSAAGPAATAITASLMTNWDVNATTPAWSIVKEGKWGATIAASGTDAGKISLKLANLAAEPGLTTTAADFTDTIVIGFNDSDGIPRTVSLPIKVNMKAAA